MLSALLIALAAAAESPELERARGQYEQMRYEQCLKSLASALASPRLSPEARAHTYLYTGLCRHQLSDEAGALEAFKEALAIDGKLELPEMVSPKARRAFERARAETAPPPAPKENLTPPAPAVEPAPAAAVAPPQVEVAPEAPRRRWPAVLCGVLSAGALGSAIGLGITAQRTALEAQSQEFGFDGDRMHRAASTQALVANVLYGTAGLLAALTVLSALIF